MRPGRSVLVSASRLGQPISLEKITGRTHLGDSAHMACDVCQVPQVCAGSLVTVLDAILALADRLE